MKYIKEFNTYKDLDMINEKITFKDVLFYVGLSAIIFGQPVYKLYNGAKNFYEVKKIYNIVNSTENYPTGEEKIFIDSVRSDIISQVKSSNLFSKVNKGYILDSLKNVTIKIVEPTGNLVVSKNSAAVFIKLGDFEELVKGNFLFKHFDMHSSKKNVILINRNHINDKDLSEIITHEIYHYVDVLLGSNKELSTTLGLSKFVDNKIIDDENYLTYKATLMFGMGKTLSAYMKSLIKDLSIMTVDNISYLSKDEEIFARWKTFKGKLVKMGYVDSLETPITSLEVSKYVKDNDISLMDLDILLTLDWSKMEELDNLIR